jgi:tetratricopeptide (TPR) repeat protein
MLRSSSLGIVLVSGVLLVSGSRQPDHASPEEGYQLAIAKLRQGALDESFAQVRRAGARWRGHPPTEWHCMFRVLEAEVLLEQAKLTGAQNLLENDLGECRNYARAEIRRRTVLAKLCSRRGGPDSSRVSPLLEEARAMAGSEEYAGLRAEIDVIRGQLEFRRNDFDSADRTWRQAQQSAQRAGDQFQYASATNNLGLIRQRRSRCDESIPYFERALQVWRKLGAVQGIVATDNNLGLCYSDLGNLDKALEYRQEALHLVKPGPRLAEVLGETGRLYLVQRRPGDAIPYFRKALDASKRFNSPSEGARWANNLAVAYQGVRDWDAAESANQEALSLKPDPHSIPVMQLNQAAIASGRGNPAEARVIYQQTIADFPGNPAVLWRAHAGLASLALAAGDWEQASQSFEAGIRVVEHSRSELNGPDHKITFLSGSISFYREYVDALMDRQLFVRALEVADSSRAQILTEGLPRNGRLEEGARGSETLKALARRSGSTWLSYWMAPRRSFLWVVTPDEIRSFVLPPESEIADAVERYRGFIETSMRDPIQTENEAGRWLFAELVGKARSLVPAGSHVVIVPDGPLHQLNFETLPVYEGKARFWLEDAVVTVAPSFGICVHQTPRNAGIARSALIIGNSDSPGPQFPKLQYAEAEISRLHQRLAGMTPTIVSGREARPDAYFTARPGQFSIIHIAAHGEANRRSPLDSALILSPGERGFKLYARDVMQVPLRADLVTLSACRSSGARTYAGEGLVGLARAFLQAGAGSVIAGLWDVSDQSTSEMMDRMYQQIAAGVAPAEALRQAKLSFHRTGYSKPYYWGPFQLYTRRPIAF